MLNPELPYKDPNSPGNTPYAQKSPQLRPVARHPATRTLVCVIVPLAEPELVPLEMAGRESSGPSIVYLDRLLPRLWAANCLTSLMNSSYFDRAPSCSLHLRMEIGFTRWRRAMETATLNA